MILNQKSEVKSLYSWKEKYGDFIAPKIDSVSEWEWTSLFKMMRLRRSSALQTHHLTLSNVSILGDFDDDDYDDNVDDADFDYADGDNNDDLDDLPTRCQRVWPVLESCFSPDRPWHQDALELHCDDDDHDVEI